VSRHVIIHWPDTSSDTVRWRVVGEGDAAVAPTRTGSLQEAAEDVDGQRATLVLSGDGVLLSRTHVPGGSASRAPVVVRYALEEQLADDVDDLHFALGRKSGADVYPVAVIGRDEFEAVLSACADAGLRPTAIVPEMLALPGTDVDKGEPPRWSVLVDGERTVVRLDEHAGFVTDTAMAGMMLAGARTDALTTDAEIQPALLLYADPVTAEELDLPHSLPVEHGGYDGDPLTLFARGLGGGVPINLLQGDYSLRRQFDRTWKPWRWSLGLAAALLLVLLGGRVLELNRLAAEEAALDDAIAQAFEQALPGSTMRRPRRQIEQALGALGAGGGGGFTDRFAQVAETLATQPQTTLNSMSVRGDRIDLDLVTDAVPTLDALKQTLEGRGDLSMEVQSAVADGDGIRARARIQ